MLTIALLSCCSLSPPTLMQQEREAHKEKEASTKSGAMPEKEKAEPVVLPIPSIEEILKERMDALCDEEVELSSDQRRRGTYELC